LRLVVIRSATITFVYIGPKNEGGAVRPMRDDNLNRGISRLLALVILLKPLSEMTHPSPNDRVVGSLVVRLSSKNADPDDALFESVIVPL
jgi:hypothetical protein